MKILSVIVPCYNSEAYMRHCVDSLLKGGENLEILIVDDGSTDGTAVIADEYQERYPDIVTAIHQENAGHGGAINTGLGRASGTWFKVVDSDDWVDEDSLRSILELLSHVQASGRKLDMLVSNYVYEKDGASHKYVMRPKGLPKDRFMGWESVRRIRKLHFILMHSVIYRTALLRDNRIRMPEHTFYEDNLYVFEPLPYVETLYYLDVDFYRYYIGRSDQSVNTDVMVRRIDQQLYINRRMYLYYSEAVIPHKACRKYMLDYLRMITAISCCLADIAPTSDNLRKRAFMWRYFRDINPKIYLQLRIPPSGFFMNLPGDRGHRVGRWIYRKAQRIVGFS